MDSVIIFFRFNEKKYIKLPFLHLKYQLVRYHSLKIGLRKAVFR